MAEENYNSGYDPEQASEDKARKRRKVLIAIVALLVLLNGFLGYLYIAKKQEAQEKQKALISTKQLKQDLEEEIKEYKSSIKGLKGENKKLDSLIAQKDSKLRERAERIRQLLEEKRIAVDKYQEARQELEQLRYYTKKYQHQIDSLVRVNKELREENYNLRTEVRETKREKSQLKDQNVRLENKVAMGSRLKLKEAKVIGVKIQNDGDKKETDNVNSIDQIKVCFNFQENPISDPGPRNMLVRLMTPKGETIYIESRGSGKFTYKNDTALYTFAEKINFENKDQTHCIYWSRGSEFSKGVYKMELYTNGYLVGRKEFELKSGFLNLF